MTDTTDHSTLPPAAKSASHNAIQAAIKETESALSKVSLSTDSTKDTPADAEADTEGDKGDESLEEGEIRDGDDSGSEAEELDPNRQITVFSDHQKFNVVHPLYNGWTLWFDNASKQDKAKSWDEQLTEVLSFDTVEAFWGLYNHIVPPSHIAANSNYYLFKKGIRPAWEDAANAKGGKWSVQLPRDKNRENIDRWWLYTMLAAIGETFETPYTSTSATNPLAPATAKDEVTGVIVSSRKAFYRINIWTRTSNDKERVLDIGRHFKFGVLGVPEGKKLTGPQANQEGGKSLASEVEFVSHEASQHRNKGKGFTVP